MDAGELNSGQPDIRITAHQMFHGGDWQEKIIGELSTDVYITLDLDVLDPGIMPSTGTPEPGGLQWYPLLDLLEAVADSRRIRGFDVVELCPTGNHAPDFLAAKLVYKMIGLALGSRSDGKIR
jgi:agmatinase